MGSVMDWVGGRGSGYMELAHFKLADFFPLFRSAVDSINDFLIAKDCLSIHKSEFTTVNSAIASVLIQEGYGKQFFIYLSVTPSY